MWIFTTDGFYSAVQRIDHPDEVLVRTRLEADMDRFLEKALLDPERKFSDTEADYLWRAYVPRQAWVKFLAESAQEMDYEEHDKDHLSRGESPRASIYLTIWHEQTRLQPEGIYSGFQGKDPYVVGLDVAKDPNITFDDAYSRGEDVPLFGTLTNEHTRVDNPEVEDVWEAGGALTEYNAPPEDDEDLDSILADIYGVTPEVTGWVAERDAARAAEDWPRANELRDQITAAGYVLEDTPTGAVVRKARR